MSSDDEKFSILLNSDNEKFEEFAKRNKKNNKVLYIATLYLYWCAKGKGKEKVREIIILSSDDEELPILLSSSDEEFAPPILNSSFASTSRYQEIYLTEFVH